MRTVTEEELPAVFSLIAEYCCETPVSHGLWESFCIMVGGEEDWSTDFIADQAVNICWLSIGQPDAAKWMYSSRRVYADHAIEQFYSLPDEERIADVSKMFSRAESKQVH